jgi:hypothetical protein
MKYLISAPAAPPPDYAAAAPAATGAWGKSQMADYASLIRPTLAVVHVRHSLHERTCRLDTEKLHGQI